MSIDQIINVLVTITLIQMMVTIGLGVTIGEVVEVTRDWSLVARAAIANYVLVPAAAVGLLLLFHAHPLVATGFLMAAVCPGAPYGPPFTGMAKGNVPIAIGLMVLLAASSAILAPLLLHFLLPVIAGNQPLRIDPVKMVGTLLLTQLIPLGIGLTLRHRRRELAEKLKKPANRLSTVLNLVAFTVILVVQFHMLESIKAHRFHRNAGTGNSDACYWLAAWWPAQRSTDRHGILNRCAQRRRQSGYRDSQFSRNARGDCSTGLCAISDDRIGIAGGCVGPLGGISRWGRRLTGLSRSSKGIMDHLKLREPVYLKTAVYGYFGRPEFSWERADATDELLAKPKKV